MSWRALAAVWSVATLALTVGCTAATERAQPYGSATGKVGESIAVLGWNMSVSHLRFEAGHVLVDVDAAPAGSGTPHSRPEDVRFGLYGALAYPIEADGLSSCRGVASLTIAPLSAPTPDRLTGTVCLGPLDNQSAVRGVYAYSPHDRIARTAVAYPAAFPVGVLPTNRNDSGVVVTSTSVEAWRADGTVVTQASLGVSAVFTGNGYMLLGLEVSALKAQYRDESAQRGGPLMVVVAPTLPPARAINPACATYGSSLLVLPDATLDAVRIDGSLCTQGEINTALFNATLSVVGTHAAVWVSRD